MHGYRPYIMEYEDIPIPKRVIIDACVLPGKERIEGLAVKQDKSYSLTTGYRRHMRSNSRESLIMEYEEIEE